MSTEMIIPFFFLKEKDWFWPIRRYVVFLVLNLYWSIHNLLFVSSSITWWIYHFITMWYLYVSSIPQEQVGISSLSSRCFECSWAQAKQTTALDLLCKIDWQNRTSGYLLQPCKIWVMRLNSVVSCVLRNWLQWLSFLTCRKNQIYK